MTLTLRTLTPIALWLLAGCAQQQFAYLRNDETAAVAIPKRDDNIQQAAHKLPSLAEPPPPIGARPLTTLHQRAVQACATMDSYIYRLKRREVVAGKKQPEELMRVSVRQKPYSVHLKWLGTEGKGREAIYVKGKYNDQMQVLLAPGDPFAFLAARVSLPLDDPMIRAKSRYPISETGFGPLIQRFGALAAAVEKNDTRGGTAKYVGRIERPEFATPLDAVCQTLPEGSDPLLPKGGERWWFFDPHHGLPVLLVGKDSSGEVEYYCHDHIIAPACLDDDDFNPDKLWRK